MPFIKERLHACRKSSNMTLQDLANTLKLSKQTVQKYESGIITKIDVERVEEIAAIINCDPAYLMGWQDHPRCVTESLDAGEKTLVDTYRTLNEQGQDKLLDLADDLVSSKKYQKFNQHELDKKQA